MDLDKPILSRDVLLIFKYFRYGIEFAVDNELERMLRYFNEHAVNELKIIQGSKLMRGPPTLSKKRASGGAAGHSVRAKDGFPPLMAEGDGEGFSLPSAVPAVRCVPLQRLCAPPTADTLALVRSAFQPPAASQSGLAAGFHSEAAPATYHHRDATLFTTLSAATFRRPAVIIYSQLGQKYGSQADSEWRHLAYRTICPALLRHVPGAVAPEKEPAAVHAQGGLRAGAPTSSGGAGKGDAAAAGRRPIDIVSLRSVDLYKYKWVHRLYVQRFARSLAPATQAHDAVLAGTTYVGTQLLAPFYPVLGVRNYLLPHVLLVDHEGVVRWMSGGCPDEAEQAVFPSLLRQLELEYYKSKNFSGRS
ncbi:hypothetical protein STCU_08707 [Strigomonas culicis]|uniref:Uncharacterized protein n=1 Tax=Strigomonas culicis TaxID=28005 RepID=S9TWY2_9TRYP|nr:hypothetical protein STCU_08707 [Strigomonas culicis]|eukprot:EPY21084.1 hypothetical protein STCU_08707 [Strigomonas culicis]